MSKKLSNEEYTKRIHDLNSNIKIKYIPKNNDEMGIFSCLICGSDFERKREQSLISRTCPVCNSDTVITGINDFATSFPDLVTYFVDINEAQTNTVFSHNKAQLKCPNCGFLFQRRISSISRKKTISCPRCNDGISFPNKLSYQILERLPVENWKTEFSPKWANNMFRYDNYFEYKGNSYALEMDGEFHYKDNVLSDTTLKEQQDADYRKDLYSKFHGIEVIRINCQSLDYDKLNDQLFNSKLNELFDLSTIDIQDCWKKASSSILNLVCDFYMKNQNQYTNKQIAKLFHISAWSVSYYLNQGNKIGLCNYSKNSARYNSTQLSARTRRRETEKAFDAYAPNGEYIGHFYTIIDCVNYLNSLNTGHVFSEKNICAVLIGARKSLWKYKFIRKEKTANVS